MQQILIYWFLCLATLLNSFILTGFGWSLKGFLHIMPCHLQIVTVLLLAFFSCLITLARTSNTVLNSSSESSHPCLFLILQETLSLQLFPVRYNVSCELIINGPFCLEVPSFHFVDRFSFFLWWKLFTSGESFLACSMLWAALFWSLLLSVQFYLGLYL